MPTTVRNPLSGARPVGAPPGAGLPSSGPPTIAVLSTYPPTQCGLATFSAALVEHLGHRAGQVGVVRIVDRPERSMEPGVVAHLVTGSPVSTAAAVRRLNDFDAVVLQHEYGIYGGPDGVDVLDIVAGLTGSLVVVMHTVLKEPTAQQRRILLELLAAADVVVTMTATARRRLLSDYGADPDATVVIPHGAIDHRATSGAAPTADPEPTRPVILTWGLIGPGKGIEWAVDALPGLQDLRPRYLVIGRTHPKVVQRDGELYRDGLSRRAAALGVTELLELEDRYLSTDELGSLLRQADVVLLPYDSREQVTSGVLIEAVAAGRPVVSTAFPHAIELLGDGTGLVVAQRDPAAIGAALRRVLTEPSLADELAAGAGRKAPELMWSAVADRYRQIVGSLVAERRSIAS